VLPQDVALNLPSPSLSADVLAYRLENAFQNAKMHLLQSQDKAKLRFDEGRKAVNFEVGDTVLYYVPIRKKGEPDKLQPKAKGPFKIVQKLGDLSYLIETIGLANPKRDRVGARHLRLFSKVQVGPESQAQEIIVQPQSEPLNPLAQENGIIQTDDPAEQPILNPASKGTPKEITTEKPSQFPEPRRSARLREKRAGDQ